MYNQSNVQHSIFVGALLLVTSFATSASAAEKASPALAAPAAAATKNAIAAGSTEDSLQACLARIPKDATARQRTVAEQSCRRDEGDRKPFQATGGR